MGRTRRVYTPCQGIPAHSSWQKEVFPYQSILLALASKWWIWSPESSPRRIRWWSCNPRPIVSPCPNNQLVSEDDLRVNHTGTSFTRAAERHPHPESRMTTRAEVIFIVEWSRNKSGQSYFPLRKLREGVIGFIVCWFAIPNKIQRSDRIYWGSLDLD